MGTTGDISIPSDRWQKHYCHCLFLVQQLELLITFQKWCSNVSTYLFMCSWCVFFPCRLFAIHIIRKLETNENKSDRNLWALFTWKCLGMGQSTPSILTSALFCDMQETFKMKIIKMFPLKNFTAFRQTQYTA